MARASRLKLESWLLDYAIALESPRPCSLDPPNPCVYFSLAEFRTMMKFSFVVPGRPAVPSNRLMFSNLRLLRA